MEIVVVLALMIFILVSWWRVFTKAGQPGWGCLIPIYNMYLIFVMAGKPGWWIVLLFIPIANLVVTIIAYIALAENFGQGAGFGLGLCFLTVIFVPILAFGSAQYVGGPASSGQMPPPVPPQAPPA